MFSIDRIRIGPWDLSVLIPDASHRGFSFSALGLIGNSVTDSKNGKVRALEWKRTIARLAKMARGADCWASSDAYAISLGFSFHAASHGNQPLDVENFIKPTLDGLAAGLFCGSADSPESIVRWNYDDAGFNHLLVHRLPPAASAAQEGVAFQVCAWTTTT